jgi:hypothetical protein
MATRLLAALGLTVILATGSAVANAFSIVNGSFEDITGMSDLGTFANGVPPGWSFTGTEVQALQSPPFAPSGVDGSYFIEILSSPLVGTLSQTVMALTIGQEYELSFLWGNRVGGYDFTIEMGGSSFSESGSGIVNMIADSFTFTATATSEDLNLTWHDSAAVTHCGGALDAFVLTPEPTTALLLAAGLAGLAAAGRRHPH